MPAAALIAPVFTLVLWSLIMMIWMVLTRVSALSGVDIPREAMVGGRGQDLDAILPKRKNWPAHNYAHLMEQPTVFYATAAGLAVISAATHLTVTLAWVYVGLRILHSIWQATVNTIPVRASLFFASSAVLLVLAAIGLMRALGIAA